MALTEKDLGKIQKMISDTFVQLYEGNISPRFDSMDDRFDRIDDRFDHVESRLDRVENRLDDHIVMTNERFDETIALIGYYYEKCAPKDDFLKLTRRVELLELKPGV